MNETTPTVGQTPPQEPPQGQAGPQSALTVRDVFELRRQGRIEEAYDAIRPMYAVHQGKYTTLAMFWTASDMLRKRVEEQRTEEAGAIFRALLRVQPGLSDDEGKGRAVLLHHALLLAKHDKRFSMLRFANRHGLRLLAEDDWQLTRGSNGSLRPALAHRLLSRAFQELRQDPTPDQALLAMPLIEAAMAHNPLRKDNRRHLAIVYTIMGERRKAVELYKDLLSRHQEACLFSELATLVTDNAELRTGLLCQAVRYGRQEKFRQKARMELARQLAAAEPSRAAFELQRCIVARKAQGYAPTAEMRQLAARLAGVVPVTEDSQQAFYLHQGQLAMSLLRHY